MIKKVIEVQIVERYLADAEDLEAILDIIEGFYHDPVARETNKDLIIDQVIISIDALRTCRVCGCTDDDCSQCIKASGEPCHWAEDDLCSRCQYENILKTHA